MGNSNLEHAAQQAFERTRERERNKLTNQESIPCGLLAILVAQGQKGAALSTEEASKAFATGAQAFKTGNPELLTSLFD